MTSKAPAERTVRLSTLKQTLAWLERVIPKGQAEQDELYALILDLRHAANPKQQGK
jgi:hypothetical protein